MCTAKKAYWHIKERALDQQLMPEEPVYEAITLPRNTPTGFITAFFAVICGFSLIWHIWWLVIAGLLGAFATFVVFAWRDEAEFEISATEVARIDRARRAARGSDCLLWSDWYEHSGNASGSADRPL